MKLLSIEDAEKLEIKEVHNHYKKFVNSGQVDLISKFGFGGDLVEKSEKT